MSETHWKKLTNPNYLGSWDFKQGEERTLTISRVSQEEVFNPTDNSKKHCTVAHFQENSKPMVLNKTNCKTIATLYKTPYIEKWNGCQITIVVEKVKAFGKLEDGLRIKNEKPKKVQAAAKTAIRCVECGNEITDFGSYSAAQIAELNRKRYGEDICANCSSKRKTIESEAANNDIN